MLIVNVGQQGMIREGVFFEPGVNVEVSDGIGKYLLEKYSNPKMAVHFQKALGAQEHEVLLSKVDAPSAIEPVAKKKRGRKPKQK